MAALISTLQLTKVSMEGCLYTRLVRKEKKNQDYFTGRHRARMTLFLMLKMKILSLSDIIAKVVSVSIFF